MKNVKFGFNIEFVCNKCAQIQWRIRVGRARGGGGGARGAGLVIRSE